MSSSDKPAEKPSARQGPLRLKAIVLLPGLLLAAGLVYWFTIDDILAEQLVAAAAASAGENGEAKVDNVSFSIFGPKLTVRELRAWAPAEDGSEREVLYMGEAVLDIEFWPLFERRLVVNEVSMTEIRYSHPPSTKESKRQDEVPTDTNQPDLNEYLKQVKELLESEELNELRDWLEKLKEYSEQDEDGDAEAEAPEPEARKPSVFKPGPAGRADFVERALAEQKAKPTVLVRTAALRKLTASFAQPDGERFVSSVTDIELSAEQVSSDPVGYGEPMRFKASGNLDGSAERRVELGLTLRFDPQQLIKLEQVDAAAGIKSLDISKLVDTEIFGKTLTDARLSLVRYSAEHEGMASRTRLMVSGAVQPPGFAAPAKASFAIWFGGYRGDGALAAFAPSGISVQVEEFPLAPILKLAGGSPLPLEGDIATISFGTCDSEGNYGTPGAAFTWHDGVEVRLRLKVNGLRFAEKQGDLAGLPGEFVLRGLNRVVEGMGGLDVMVGFQGKRDGIALSLERPGLRAFVDAIINALYLSGPELKSLVELPFEVSSSATVGLASVNADGTPRDAKLTIAGEHRHDLNDLRVSLNLTDARISPKAGQSSIAGLPAADFCKAFNLFMESLGEQGLRLRTRVMNDKGVFSPALESPGLRGLVDSMISVFTYTGAEINASFGLPVNLSPGATIKLASIDPDGTVRSYTSAGGDSHDLKDLRVRLLASNVRVSPKPGQSQVLGLPANDFCRGMNAFLGDGGELKVISRLFDGETFSPWFESPGARGFVDALIGALSYSGIEFAQSFNLPVSINPDSRIRLASTDKDGIRGLSSPGAESSSLDGLRIRAVASNLVVSPKPGQNNVAGLPAKEFCTAMNTFLKSQNQGLTLELGVFNAQGTFTPTLHQPGVRGLVDGIANTLRYGGNELNRNFNLPFELVPEAMIETMSVDAQGKQRTINSPGSGDSDLKELRLRVILKNGFAAKKAGQNTILGIPADSFTFAWNKLMTAYPQGFPMTLKLFDAQGTFAPALVGPTEQELIKQLGAVMGIDDLAKNFGEIAKRYGVNFEDFQKRGIDAAKDIASGKIKLPGPGELPKEQPKLPEVPKPKLPWEK